LAVGGAAALCLLSGSLSLSYQPKEALHDCYLRIKPEPLVITSESTSCLAPPTSAQAKMTWLTAASSHNLASLHNLCDFQGSEPWRESLDGIGDINLTLCCDSPPCRISKTSNPPLILLLYPKCPSLSQHKWFPTSDQCSHSVPSRLQKNPEGAPPPLLRSSVGVEDLQ
jgi:hypothetical protein